MATTTDIASPGITLSGNATQTPEQTPSLTERMNHTLLNIIRENFNTKYATQTPILSAFRDAVAAHGGTGVDATLLADFQSNVPLSNYDCYKPFADKFNAQPCKKKEVENLFAPGLPDFLAVSGSTTGLTSKIFPRYANTAPRPRFLDPNFKSTVAALQQYRYTDVKEIEHAPGEMVQKIPVCSASVGVARMRLGWKLDDDETWMSLSSTFLSFNLDDLHSFLLPPSAVLRCTMGSHRHQPLSFIPDNLWSILPYASGHRPFFRSVRDGVRRLHA